MTSRRMPAEWEPHLATWLAWPHNAEDWLGDLKPVHQTYIKMIEALSRSECVEILCDSESVKTEAQDMLMATEVHFENINFHIVAMDRSWLRDSAPTFVKSTSGERQAISWHFNGWAKYEDYTRDQHVAAAVAELAEVEHVVPRGPASTRPIVLEGGAIETDGEGTLLVTEECLLSAVQERNPGFRKEDYEAIFRDYLGIEKTIWLAGGVTGDDTHGHIDDIARFVAPRTVIVVEDERQDSKHHAMLAENVKRLRGASDAKGRTLRVELLPMPSPVEVAGMILPASYANFYIANEAVLVPTFQDQHDDYVLSIFERLFPDREVIGIDCCHFVIGQGTIHCSTQQQPA